MSKISGRLGEDEDLLSDDVVGKLVAKLSPIHRIFLAGLGRGLSPEAAARRAGCEEKSAHRMAQVYLGKHPIVRRLAAHVLRMRELATLDGEEPVFDDPGSVH